jgi:Na+/H+ antiporter NhaD/arsenite permease-like protein
MPPETILVFILIYVLVVLLSAIKMVPMSVAALLGALLTAWFGLQYDVFTYVDAIDFIDVRLISLLIGIMIVVEVADRGGLFRLGALYSIKIAKGNPRVLFITLCIMAAVASMFLSDSTAILLIAAAAITITKLLDYDPVPFFISATIMVNLGGTSTLIGSVSNMIIGVEAGISFNDFIGYLAVAEIILWALTILVLYYYFRSRLRKKRIPPTYNPWESIQNKKLFWRSTAILFLLIFLFVFSDIMRVEPEAVALGCAILALAVSEIDPAEIFKRMDWETIFFLTGFLFVVGGLEKTGLLGTLSTQLFQLAGGSLFIATLLVLWSSGLASTIVSNMAVALTFTPIVQGFIGLNKIPMWSALALGTNLGGAATPFSGSVVIMALGAMKKEGIKLNFSEFTKVGFITTFIQVAFATVYIIIRFGIGG